MFTSHLRRSTRRQGATLVFAAVVVTLLFIAMAVSLNTGLMMMTKTQLQAASDASALAAAIELPDGLGAGATKTQAQVETAAETVAVAYAALHRAGHVTSAFADPDRDVRFGNAVYDSTTQTWTKTWEGTPMNMVGVTLHQDQAGSSNADAPLSLWFPGFLTVATKDVTAPATAVLMPGSTFKPEDGETCVIIPFALDWETWEDVIDGYGPDEYYFDPEAPPGADPISHGTGDGKTEANLYPQPSEIVPNSGNRGTVDIGRHGNSTNDIKRQILHGVNADDLSYFPDGLHASWETPLTLNGDTGMSSGFEAQLESIIGQERVIPVFSETDEGSGNNANYQIIKFVGVRILAVKLHGNPDNRHVWVQPATVVDACLEPDLDGEITDDSIFAPLMLIE